MKNPKLKYFAFSLLIFLTIESIAGKNLLFDNIWQTLFKVTWEKKYSAELKTKVEYPKFSPEVKALDGKEIVISGYVLPTDLYEGEFVVLSAYPMAQCFFCGGAGPETVMEVYTRNKRRSFATERVTFKGKLELNESDFSHLIYKLNDAVQYFETE